MKKIFLALLVLTSVFSACSQKPEINNYIYQLGNTALVFKEIRYDTVAPIKMISVHNNEITGIQTGEIIAEKYKINFFQFLNENKRMVDFKLYNNSFTIDPNRIYTEVGILNSLNANKDKDQVSFFLLQKLSDFIIYRIDTAKAIVAVHNNTDGEYDINRYLGSLKNDAENVHVNPAKDPDDFYLTTDARLFEELKKLDFNVILQNNTRAADDGSMSIYYGRKGIPYVNVEAQHGHKDEQLLMLDTLIRILQELY